MDKIDAYDKEQLQGMDWLFDETQASDSGTLLVGEYMAVTPISKGQLVVCQQNAKVAYVFSADNNAFAFDQAVFAVAQSDAAANEPVNVMMYGGTFEATGVTGSGVELYAVCHMERDVYTASSVLYFDHLTFDTPEPLPSYLKGTVAIALGNTTYIDDTGTTVRMYNQSKYFYVMNVFDETHLVDLANPVNVFWISQVLGTSVEFGTGFYIVPYGGTVPAADLERAVGASALILTNTPSEDMPKIYLRGRVSAEGNIYFYSFTDAYTVMSVILNSTTGAVSPVTANNITAGLLSYGRVQNLSIDDTNRVMSNIGLDIMVVNITNGSATLTQEQADALFASNGVIFTGSGTDATQTMRMKNRIFFRQGNSFYAVYNAGYKMFAEYNPDTKSITIFYPVAIQDTQSVHFTAQNLTEVQQAQARANIGITQGLLNDADFIAELKTKLGLT